MDDNFYVPYEANEIIVFTAIPWVANACSEKYRIGAILALLVHLTVLNILKFKWKKFETYKSKLTFQSISFIFASISFALTWLRIENYIYASRILFIGTLLIYLIVAIGLYIIAKKYADVSNTKKTILKGTTIIEGASSVGALIGFFGLRILAYADAEINFLSIIGILMFICSLFFEIGFMPIFGGKLKSES